MQTPESPFEPPQSSLDSRHEPDSDFIKGGGIFLLKCIVFAIVFWTLWLFLIRPLSNAVTSSSNAQSEQAQEDQSELLMKKYWEQARAADELQTQYKRQAIESATHLKKQAELLDRFEAVIEKWERQAGGRK